MPQTVAAIPPQRRPRLLAARCHRKCPELRRGTDFDAFTERVLSNPATRSAYEAVMRRGT